MEIKRKKLLKNILLLLLFLLLTGGSYLFYIAKQHRTDFTGAMAILWERWGTLWKSDEGERLTTVVHKIWVENLIQGNYYVGEDFPAGVYELDAGNSEWLFRICQDGEILREGILSVKEGSSYPERQTGIHFQEGQILILMGEGTALLQSEEGLDYVDYPEGIEQRVEQRVTLGTGSYTVGEELPAGECELFLGAEDRISVTTSRPYEGGVELTRDPKKEDRSEIYQNVRLQDGDTVTIQGGEVEFTYLVDVYH